MRRRLAAAALSAILGITAGCSHAVMDDVTINPPKRGLLYALQSEKGGAAVSSRGYEVRVIKPSGFTIAGGTESRLTLAVFDAAGVPVDSFTEDMTKLMHLIVVSRDMSSFAHLHPSYEGEGRFKVSYRFPSGGDYMLIAEFNPDHKGITVHRQRITVSGAPGKAVPVTPDSSYRTTVKGVEVTLSAMPDMKSLQSGRMVMLEYRFNVPGSKEKLRLERYLGTPGHCVILDQSQQKYIHVHASAEMSTDDSVMFHAEFPSSGIYKLWGQFQYKGEILVVPFVVQVE